MNHISMTHQCLACGSLMPTDGHVCPPQTGMRGAIFPPGGKGINLDERLDAERERCLKILEEEIARGRSLLGLLDTAGKPVFDDNLTQACIEALEYASKRIREELK